MIVLLAAVALQVVTPAHVQQAQAGAPAIRVALDRELLDYPSARFRDVRVTINLEAAVTARGYLCGYVNAQNRAGGYAGWSRFMATADDQGGMVMIEPVGTIDTVVDGACGRGGTHAFDATDRSGWLAHR